MNAYLLLEKGSIERRVFLLQERLSIGRMSSNDICPSDPSVSRQHAVVYLSQGKAVVEDLGSLNGTFVNGNRVEKEIISSGDILRFGDVVFRFIQEELKPDFPHHKETREESDYARLTETREVADSEISVSWDDGGHPSGAQRLIDAIANAPLFSNLEEDELLDVSRAAYPVVFDRSQTIIQEGERSRSLYIILQGSVRVLTYDQQGKEIELERLSQGQIFGEISLLMGVPRTATVQALEETLLCEVSFEAMREILNRRPVIKGQFEAQCRTRQEDREAKKRGAGIIDRRTQPRLKANLPVSFSISGGQRAGGRFRGKVFRSFSEDISASGINIKVQDQALLGLPSGCRLRLEISLPHPWGVISCSGALINKETRKERKDLGYLHVKFVSISKVLRNTLEEFIQGD